MRTTPATPRHPCSDVDLSSGALRRRAQLLIVALPEPPGVVEGILFAHGGGGCSVLRGLQVQKQAAAQAAEEAAAREKAEADAK